MSRFRHLIVLLGLTALLSACAGRTITIPPPEAFADVPATRQLQQVPFYAQDAYQCGPAALAMVLNHRGKQATPEALKDRVYIPERKGTLQVELVAAARERDLLVYPLAGKLEDLITEIDAGNPVLVMQNLAFDWLPQWHYAVVIGYDLNKREMIVHSGLNKAQREPFKVFMRTWQRANHWALVMMPPGQLPATAEPLHYLLAASDLEQTGRLNSAATAYQTAMQRWPDQATARFGLGNVAWAQGRKQEAVEHFRVLVTDFPELEAGWNNLAFALEATGCEAAAEAVRACSTSASNDESESPTSANGQCLIPACN